MRYGLWILFWMLLGGGALYFVTYTALLIRGNVRANELLAILPRNQWVVLEQLHESGYAGFITQCALWILFDNEYLKAQIRDEPPSAITREYAKWRWYTKRDAAEKTGFTSFTVPYYRFQLVKGGHTFRARRISFLNGT